MILKCSTCGRIYPSQFQTNTCRLCGGLLENAEASPGLSYQMYTVGKEWHEWRRKVFSAPPRFLSEPEWLRACAHFNGCAICGIETIDEKLLVVPPHLKGKLYTYNVVPACSYCAEKIRHSQVLNPLRPFYKYLSKDQLKDIFSYLESKMYDAPLEYFDFEEDKIEIVVKVVEDTSDKPFDGIFARRMFEEPKLHICSREELTIYTAEENNGISWRLL